MNNIVKVRCMHFWSDWTDINDIEINLDNYVFFEIDYRGDKSWHIKGHKCNDKYEWAVEELSDHCVCNIDDLAEFIAYANAYGDKYQRCKVSRFNNLHYYDGFYDKLTELFERVKVAESKMMESNKEESPFMEN